MKGSNTAGRKTALVAVRAIVIGAVTGALLCALLLAICALAFVSSENIPHDLLPALVIAVTVISAFFSGFVTVKMTKQNGLLCGSIAGMFLFLLFLISGLAVSQSGSGSEIFFRFLLMVISGGMGGLIAVNGKSRRK